MAKAKEKLSFEDALQRLEQSIAHLESDDLTLENALNYFEQGIGLIRQCDEHLKKTDGKLRELLKDSNGSYVEELLGINLQSALGGEEIDE